MPLEGQRQWLLATKAHESGPLDRAIFGALAQLGERLICIQEVSGSIPLGSTILQIALQFVRLRQWLSARKRTKADTLSI